MTKLVQLQKDIKDLEAANMIAKQLIYLAGAEAAGIVLGARVPIMLTSRADGDLARLASCALAQLFARVGWLGAAQRLSQRRCERLHRRMRRELLASDGQLEQALAFAGRGE